VHVVRGRFVADEDEDVGVQPWAVTRHEYGECRNVAVAMTVDEFVVADFIVIHVAASWGEA
jgi:hypothetical protein